jgi:hypothetical protein
MFGHGARRLRFFESLRRWFSLPTENVGPRGQAESIAKCVIAADRDERVDAEPGEIFENFGSEIVPVGGEFAREVGGEVGLADAARIGAGRMEEGAAGMASAIGDCFVDDEKIVGVVVVLFANHVDEAGPATADADDLIAFSNGTKGDAADRGIEAGNVTATCEYADDPFFGFCVCHELVTHPLARVCDRKLSSDG